MSKKLGSLQNRAFLIVLTPFNSFDWAILWGYNDSNSILDDIDNYI